MNILVTVNSLSNFGGSESFTFTMVEELIRRKHKVDVVVSDNVKGVFYHKIKSMGVRISQTPIKKKYDIVLGSHNNVIEKVKHLKCPIIQTSHGKIINLEQPTPVADYYVSISDEVKQYLTQNGYESTIIYNGINLERFKPNKPINKSLKNVLSLSQSFLLNNTLKSICNRLNVNFRYRDKFENPIFNIEDDINEADLVISLGRGAYEAMACGRPVLVLDDRIYVRQGIIGDGIITPDNIENIMKFNCSGRFTNTVYSYQKILNEIKKYDHTIGDFLRDFAERELDIKKQVDKYLNLI